MGLHRLREATVTVPGGKVWTGTVGSGTPGIPLLVLHGGPGAPHDYLEPLQALADQRPVVFYDQLGCGSSDRPDDPALWTVERFVEELVRVRAALHLERVHILGSSWGTMLAVEYMLARRPDGVAGLVLSGPCLSASRFTADVRAYLQALPEPVRRTILEKEAYEDFESPEYQEAMTAFYRKHVCRVEPWPDCLVRTIEKMGQAVYRHMWGPSEFTVTGTLKNFERVERLAEIRVPALFTCGRFDEATPEATAWYRDSLPGSEMAVFEDASHEHHLEKPEAYLQTVRDFLRRAEDNAPRS